VAQLKAMMSAVQDGGARVTVAQLKATTLACAHAAAAASAG
jgi:malate/lactate dehydrogenase